MLHRTLLARDGPASSTAGKKGAAIAQKYFSWYPVKGGEFLGNFLAGHNLFIADIPKKFDKAHARHFSLVEGLTIVPLFTLTTVHYFSTFCQFPNRARLVPPLCRELGAKTALQNEWMQVLQQKSPTDALAWRLAMLALQVGCYPLCLLLSCVAPQMVHATLEYTNHILATKYECISAGPALAFIGANVAQCRSAEDFHRQQVTLPTDFGAAVVLLLMVFYLTS